MHQTRLFLKMSDAEHTILKIAKTKMRARSYRELIVTLLDGDYVDYICSSVLTEKALRRIIVNLYQLARAIGSTPEYKELISQINNTTAILSEWNDTNLKPIISHRDNIKEIQIRLTEDEKTTISSAKIAVGFRTYSDLVMNISSRYISGDIILPEPPDYSLFNKVGTSLNAEAKWYNTNGGIDAEKLNSILDDIYTLTSELDENLILLGGCHVS